MKYRVILSNSDHTPFQVQRMNEKSFFKIWWNVNSFVRQNEAESFIRRAVGLRAQHEVGKVIFEYEDADAVIDKLKSQKINYQTEEGISMEGTCHDTARESGRSWEQYPSKEIR